MLPEGVSTEGPSVNMNEETRKKMWSDAKKNNIKPYPKQETVVLKR